MKYHSVKTIYKILKRHGLNILKCRIRNKKYSDDELQEILSINEAITQNTKKVNDRRAIRNSVSHASFNIQEKNSVYRVK